MANKVKNNIPSSHIFNSENSLGLWKKAAAAFIFLLIILTLVFRFTLPIGDTDLWFHMAYGKYMVEHLTLVPDHTIYTWTSSDPNSIYCAWIPQILLLVLYRLGGLAPLFILQYLLFIIFIGIAFYYAYLSNNLFNPFVGLIILMGLLMSKLACQIKPEIFSFLYMTCFAAIWFFIKSKYRDSWKLLYLFPLVMFFWVNSHGVFLFGLPFIAAVFIGELINHYFSPGEALSKNMLKHLFISGIMSGLILFATPYGYTYLLYLINMLTSHTQSELEMVPAFAPSFKITYPLYVDFVVDYLFYASAILIGLIGFQISRKKRPDYSVILINIIYGILYVSVIRLAFFWGPVFAFSAIYLISKNDLASHHQRQSGLPLGSILIIIFGVFLSVRAVFTSLYVPIQPLFFGLGQSYQNPVEETDYFKKHLSGLKLGNSFNIGGYFLWHLDSSNKHMVDGRWFAFAGEEWFSQYLKFSRGEEIETFIKKYPCDVWFLDFGSNMPQTKFFVNSPEWKIAFYGKSSAIFVRKDIKIPETQSFASNDIVSIKNLGQAANVLYFAIELKDWITATRLMENIKNRFTFFNQIPLVDSLNNYLHGIKAYHERDYLTAIRHLERGIGMGMQSNEILVKCYHHAAVLSWTENNFNKTYEYILQALVLDKTDLYGIFNLGIIEWWAWSKGINLVNPIKNITVDNSPGKKDGNRIMWESSLKWYIMQTRKMPGALVSVKIAENIMKGKYRNKPPLIEPLEPNIGTK